MTDLQHFARQQRRSPGVSRARVRVAHQERGVGVRVLIVEDDADLRDVTRAALEVQGWSDVTLATDCASALDRLAHETFDLVILDVQLPDGSGLDLVRQLRSFAPDAHAIIVSGASSEDERVAGLAAGADDYVVKPFSVRELIARITAVHRRRVASASTSIHLNDVSIDVVARTVTVGGVPVILTRREFELLRHLAASPGRTFTREELLSAVWGSSSEWQSDATVTEHISRLRRKVEADAHRPSRIVTSRGVGYRFDVAPVPAPGPAPSDGNLPDAGDATIVVAGMRIVAATPAVVALLRAPGLEDVVGQTAMHFVAPVSEAAAQVRRLQIQAGTWPRPELLTLRRHDGEEVLVELASTSVTWNGTPATQMTVWDLTRDTARLRELATGIHSDVADAVVVADGDERIQSFNAAAEDLYGWREAEVIGRSIFDTLVGAEQRSPAVRESLVRDGRWHGVAQHRRRDGSAVAVSASVTLVKDGAGQPVGLVAVNRPAVATPIRSPDAPSEIDLSLDVRRGLNDGEFEVHYQPVVR
ncbi:MAG: two-component system, OmpR family, response regulator PrrA, partial [Actinomycetota bacterium]|nr:two-component system, OmpR family, response regulator PrrA [Actinomycetota bacterium]